MEKFIDQNRLRQFFFIILLLLLGILLFWQLYFFLPALLGAVTLYVLMRRYMFYLTEKEKWRHSWAALFLLFASGAMILLPVGLLIEMVSNKIYYAFENSAQIIQSLKKLANDLEAKVGQEFVSDANINKLGTFLTERIPVVLGATVNSVLTLFFTYFLLYFMLMRGREMEKSIYEYIPLKDDNVALLRKDVHNMVVSNAIGIPVIALMQGIVGLIGYLIFGVSDPWFWFVVTCITAMIPVVGAALAYVPVGIIFLANSQVWQGVAILLYGFIIIGTVDNIFRFALQKKIGNIHPLITVFGVIIGIQLFGFIGLIFGPLLISLFLVLLKIYSNEFMLKKRAAEPLVEN